MMDVYSQSLMFMLISSTASMNARPNMVFQHLKKDPAATAKMLGMMGSLGAALEFLLNPVFGSLSDKYGRLPFIMLGPIGNVISDG